ncbi:shikimate kinase AroK [Thermoclostridium stercorarium subsp. stercorarium DSM 8532]|jgi:shikimate kinase|uniref:Shikimate kinase n=3 Tax=Thermoclostridium stercorarium TaxID=1510 RepID=L7VRU3_THES1|nr:shikimate kinase [Thermoclostridium stercorarium]AGC68288.1 shikimate kinase AroK [Thermoclostridium stercorarium subsp. stercorarium DSM 8532]AGI39317.1 shikimate kinase [Thermoclostridium stercorarium subsp. stercorarium DSM 8532]ANW98645.1 shikimate kinase [Thermoclostridium stercorarium subsp. thermolacticum DSM 2910]ANX01187.1 shikimate kinase [Thermoclostridium stercorarium subsp. leptospartum DSM 9219]UZQ86799.1 shikimate kinase [Thermoclostridium stercorarium]
MKYSNIVLTGIMGSGKTTVGRMLAEKLNMGFVDTDWYIEGKYGKIHELFEKGEDYFREIEHKAVLEISEMEGVVIATGGGVVKRQDNVYALKKKGIIFFLDRPLKNILSDIETSGRPLLKNGKEKLIEIYHERYPLYTATCDVHINNSATPDKAVSEIIDYWLNIGKNR